MIEMTLYAKLTPDLQVLEVSEWGFEPPDFMRTGTPNNYWVPYISVDPAFNPDTQVRTGPVREILADKVTDTWTVRAKTAQELDLDKENKLSGIDFLQFELGFDHENRIRTLEGKAAITKVQFRNALKARL
jgi:hypothetical protein